MTGAQLIAAERLRQRLVKGYTSEHDAIHGDSALVSAAICYAEAALCVYAPDNPRAAASTVQPPAHPYWPWGIDDYQCRPFADGAHGAIRSLVKAGALIAAEIDRLEAQQPAAANPLPEGQQ
jgi:hypothetical protein